jgi:hypothetical protein
MTTFNSERSNSASGLLLKAPFEVVRNDVDAAIGAVVPGALTMLAGAFENASSDNAEHWANAASTCRRLLKEVADAVRPPGEDVVKADGKKIRRTDSHYITAHATVTRLDASRFITGTYLVLGDVLRGYTPPSFEAPAAGSVVEQPDVQQSESASDQTAG